MQIPVNPRRTLILLAVFCGFWMLLILAFAAQLVFTASFPWDRAILASLHDWLPWVLLSPLVIWLARRFPLELGRLRVSVPAHLLGCFLALVLCGTISDLFFSAYLEQGVRQVASGERPFGPEPAPPEPGPPGPGIPWEGNAHPPPGPDGPRMRGPRGPGGPDAPGARPRHGPWERRFWAVVFWNRSKLNLPVYWVIVSAVHAFGFYRRVQERDRRALELTASLSRAKIEALRLQMQPHFLFNTLNAISTLIHRDPDAADEMIVNLSDLLRQSLDATEQEVPLRRELELLDRYLEIERVRLGDRLRVERDISSEAMNATVPTLMLQTLVENAVRHGIEPKESGGTVHLAADLDGDTLRISVRDDGVGFSENDTSTERRGIGLVNTESRLAELYGPSGKLAIHAPATGGVIVEVTIPFRRPASAAGDPQPPAGTRS